MSSTRSHKATETHRVTFSDEPAKTHRPRHEKGSHIYSNGSPKGVQYLTDQQKHPTSMDYHVHVRSVERMPSTKPEGPHFPNLQLMFNQKPVYGGKPGEVVHEVPVVLMEEKKEKKEKKEKREKKEKEKNEKAEKSEKEKTGGKVVGSYQDVDGFAVEFLKKKHEFFERQRLLSMQMRT